MIDRKTVKEMISEAEQEVENKMPGVIHLVVSTRRMEFDRLKARLRLDIIVECCKRDRSYPLPVHLVFPDEMTRDEIRNKIASAIASAANRSCTKLIVANA